MVEPSPSGAAGKPGMGAGPRRLAWRVARDAPRGTRRVWVMHAGWQFWIDRGGTFTDVVGRAPDGSIRIHKLLSENPEQYRDAAIQGIRDLLGLGKGEPLPDAALDAIKMGTTVATNALLERKGTPTVLATPRALGDALRIPYKTRPDFSPRRIVLPEQL